MKSQSGSALIFSSLLALSATALAACQPDVGVGADPETAVKGNATPAASPVKADPEGTVVDLKDCLLYTSPSPRDRTRSRMPSSA